MTERPAMPDTDTDPFPFAIEADRLFIAAAVLAEVDLAGLNEAITATHTLAPILDPTRYRDALQAGHLDDVAALANLARPLVAKYAEIKARRG